MRFLLEFMACCGSCSSTSMVKEESRLLVASEPPPSSSEICRSIRGRKRGRGVGTARSGRNYNSGGGSSSGAEWRPSLSSICEDDVFHERNKHEHRRQEVAAAVVRSSAAVVRSSPSSSSSSSSERNLKRKITSTPRPRSYCPGENVRRPAVQAVMPTFSPAPFMF